MKTSLLFLNLLVALASAVAAVIAVNRPAFFSGSGEVSGGELFYMRMYAARSVPLGIVTGILPFWSTSSATAWVILTAALIQILDVVVAVGKKNNGMVIGASIGAVVHLLCGLSFVTIIPGK